MVCVLFRFGARVPSRRGANPAIVSRSNPALAVIPEALVASGEEPNGTGILCNAHTLQSYSIRVISLRSMTISHRATC